MRSRISNKDNKTLIPINSELNRDQKSKKAEEQIKTRSGTINQSSQFGKLMQTQVDKREEKIEPDRIGPSKARSERL